MKCIKAVVTAVLLFPFAAGAAELPEGIAFDCAAAECRLEVDWRMMTKTRVVQVEASTFADRITPGSTVVAEVLHFNFLNWELAVEVEDEEVASYTFLEELFRRAVGGLGLFEVDDAPGAPRDTVSFYRSLNAWRSALREMNRSIDAALEKHQAQALSVEAAAALKEVVDSVADQRAEVLRREAETAALVDEVGTGEAIDRYEATLATHQTAMARAAAFQRASRLGIDGFRRTIPRKDSGRLVTVSLQAKRKDGAEDGSSLTARYFVHSSMPVYYHVGYGHSELSEVEFEKVRTLAGADLFTKVAENDGTEAFAAFMSYDLRTALEHWGLGGVPLAVTLGTDFSEPGQRLYGGLSLSFGRFILSGGYVSGSVAEGEGATTEPIVDPTGAPAGTRELFNSIRERREWEPFFAITMKPF